jgi:uncharacterized protein YjbI with pentapeptide repeats
MIMGNSSEPVVHERKRFANVNYAGKRLENREFIKCEFADCDFSKGDLRGNDFVDCHFKNCNFSMVDIGGAGFRDVVFTGCKILGVDFARCNKFMFSFSFIQCHLDYSTFFGAKLSKTHFKECSLKEVDFSESDLSGSVFEGCDLFNTRFLRTRLEKTDFRTARNFAIDPDANVMKKAKFSVLNLSGLLSKHNIDIDYGA